MLGTTPDFHPGGRGSIPRLGSTLFYYFFQKIRISTPLLGPSPRKNLKNILTQLSPYTNSSFKPIKLMVDPFWAWTKTLRERSKAC